MTDKKKYNNNLPACICILTIAIITYFVFSPSLDNGFTNLDDIAYVINNPLVVNNVVLVIKIFKTPVSGNYHPITILSLALNHHNAKLNPFGYHLENLIFHLLNTILVFLFVFLLTRRNLLMAAIVSLFFGIHPMHVESVSWISERKDVLYVFFFLAGLIAYLRYSETKKIAWYWSAFLLFILSCLSKGMAVVFPVVLLLIDYLKDVKWERRLWIEKIPFFILSLVFGIITINVQQTSRAFNAMNTYTVFQRLLFASYGAVMYVAKLFVPYKLSVLYLYPDINQPGGIPLIFYLSPVILLLMIGALVYFFRKREKEIVFGLLFYFVTVVLVLQFVSVGYSIMNDRYSYLSYIGLLFVVAYLINKVWLRLNQNKNAVWALIKYSVVVIAAIVALVFSLQAHSRTQVWKNSETLWTNVIDNYPDADIAYVSRGNYYYSNKDMEKAMSDYTTALQLPHSDVANLKSAYCSRGVLYAFYYKRNDLAIADFNEAIALDSGYKEAYTNRGSFYLKNGNAGLAMSDFNKAIALDSNCTDAYSSRGLLYLSAGKNDLAMSDFSKAISLDAATPDNYNNLGSCYYNAGKYDSALADFTKAIDLNPAFVNYYYNRGCCYNAANQYEKALADFTRCIQLNPQNAGYFNTRGICNVNFQKYSDAIADFSQAIELNPAVGGYWLNRSVAENKAGQSENAKADEQKGKQLQNK